MEPSMAEDSAPSYAFFPVPPSTLRTRSSPSCPSHLASFGLLLLRLPPSSPGGALCGWADVGPHVPEEYEYHLDSAMCRIIHYLQPMQPARGHPAAPSCWPSSPSCPFSNSVVSNYACCSMWPHPPGGCCVGGPTYVLTPPKSMNII